MSEEDAENVREIILQTIAGGVVSEQDGRWLTNAGKLVDVAWSCTPLPMIDDGQLYLIYGTDITERKSGDKDEVHLADRGSSRPRTGAPAAQAGSLHDGAQQRLVALLLSLRATRQEAAGDPALQARIDAAIDELAGALHDLRELAAASIRSSLTRRGELSGGTSSGGRPRRCPWSCPCPRTATRLWRRRPTTSSSRR